MQQTQSYIQMHAPVNERERLYTYTVYIESFSLKRKFIKERTQARVAGSRPAGANFFSASSTATLIFYILGLTLEFWVVP